VGAVVGGKGGAGMRVTVTIELTDDQRDALATSWGDWRGLASKDEIKDWIEATIERELADL
jgi:hypothetical protein